MQEGKSKRDLIWEQKKRAREALLQNGGAGRAGSQNIPENNPPPVFAKKSPIYDNPEPEIIQPTQPLGSQDTNRTRKFANVMDDIQNNKPASQPSNNNPRMQVQDFAAQDHFNQPRAQFADQEPMMMMNQNQPRRHVEEPMQGGPKPNFNPSYQQSAGYEPIGGRESREGGLNDPRKKKADYGEELRNQMKNDQMKKQREKNEVRNSQNLNQQQQQQGGDQYFKEIDKRRKEEYGDYLKQQMQAKQESKRQEIARDMYERPPPQQNFPPQQQPYSQRNQQQQQVYMPPQQQQQPIMRQQPQYQQPERLEMNNDPYGQRQAGYAIERAGSVEPLQRAETIDYGRGNSVENVDNLMPRYQRGNTIEGERGGKRKGFESEDPTELAKKDRMKQDFQKGLQEQVEFKKRQKEMEKQRQLQEDRIEEERIRKEQEELARRQAEEDPKKKVMAKLQNMEQNANHLMQQQQQFVKEKPARNRSNVQSFDQQAHAPPSQEQNQFQPPPQHPPHQQGQGYPQQQPPPYYPPPYGHAYPYGHPYPPPYGQPYPQPYGYPGHPGQHPYYPPPQQPASFPSMPRNEAISNELQQIRTEMQNQQAVLAKQLQLIQKEALNVMDGRDKAEQELLHLREKLKDKISHDNAYDKNLRDVLERNNPNAQTKAPRTKDSNPVRAIHRDPEPALEAYSYQTYQPKSNKANPNPGSKNNIEKNYEEFTFPAAPDINKPTYDVRRTNQKVNDDQYLPQLDDSYMPALDIEKTLSGNTKMIPLAVFDNKQGLENTRSLDRDPLTLSKIHNFASSNLGQMHSNQKNNRPNSSKQQWQKEEDSIDFLIKAHGARPGSSESGYGDTSHMIGRGLDEASELLRRVDVMGKGGDRTNMRSRDKETFSMAGRNILGDGKQSMNVGNYGGSKPRGYPESERGSLISRGDEGIRMNNNDLLPDLSMNSHQAMEHFGNPANDSLMNMTGTSFNVERINLANEARLKKWDSVGGGSIRSDGRNYDQYGGAGRGNYYGRGGGGGLEAIQEDDDAHDKLDKMLGGYLKTHEDLKGQDDRY